MEIERKYLITHPPKGYETHPSSLMGQAYLQGKGLLAREEHNLPLTKDAYLHLLPKADGIVLTKRRYRIPLPGSSLVAELDIFFGEYQGLMLAEVEFPSVEDAEHFTPPAWFGRDVTFSGEYQNSKLSAGI